MQTTEQVNNGILHDNASDRSGNQPGAGAILNTFNITREDSLIVFGTGAVGLSAVMAGLVAGASPLIAVYSGEPAICTGSFRVHQCRIHSCQN